MCFVCCRFFPISLFGIMVIVLFSPWSAFRFVSAFRFPLRNSHEIIAGAVSDGNVVGDADIVGQQVVDEITSFQV